MSNKPHLCIVSECANSKRLNKGIKFCSLPLSDEKRRLRWLQLVNRTDLKDRITEGFLVCAEHFTDLTSSELAPQDLYPNFNLPMPKLVPTSSTNGEETDILNDDDELKEYNITVTLDSESDEDIDHQSDAHNSTLLKETDKSVKKSKMLIPVCDNAYDYFNLFISDTFLTLVAEETNKFAQAEEENYDKEEWFDTNTQELKVFLGLLLHMGTFRMEHEQDYWETDRLFTAGFTDFMPFNRFRQIFNYLSFASDKNDGDKLWKIRPIIDNFNTVMKKTYNPKKVLIVDESAWQEREDTFFLLDVAEKEEPADSGNSLYLLREIDGIVLSLYVHEPTADIAKPYYDIILELVKNYLDSGRTLYLHGHQASYELAKKLLARETYCSGTLSETASNIPDEVATAHLNVMDNTACSNDGVLIGKWRYWKDKQVFYLTTEKVDSKVLDLNSIQRKNTRYSQAPPVLYSMWLSDYTKLNYGACYPLQNTKSPDTTKFFIHFLMISLINAHKLYSDFVKHRNDLSDFRMEVIEHLLPESVPEVIAQRLPVPHHLGRLLEPDKCMVCVKQDNLNISEYYCQECPLEPPLCVECFCDIHC